MVRVGLELGPSALTTPAMLPPLTFLMAAEYYCLIGLFRSNGDLELIRASGHKHELLLSVLIS